MDVYLQTLEGWVYIVPIHGPLDVPLYTGSHIHQQIYYMIRKFADFLFNNTF